MIVLHDTGKQERDASDGSHATLVFLEHKTKFVEMKSIAWCAYWRLVVCPLFTLEDTFLFSPKEGVAEGG